MQKAADEALVESARLSPTVVYRPLACNAERAAQGVIAERAAKVVIAERAAKGVIYIFSFGEAWVKMGYASQGPWRRKAQGFWHLKHPPELCGRLDECKLLRLWSGSLELEQALHKVLGADCGEFYRAERLPEIEAFLGNVLEPRVLPEDPDLEPRPPQKLNCCDPERRHPDFRREIHGCRSFATKGKTAPCRLCGTMVSIRFDKLKQHQKSAKCQQGRQ